MFEMKDKPDKMLFHMVNIWCVDELSDEEKEVAQGLLMAALEKNFDRRWVWALGEVGTKEAYDFLMNQYENERDTSAKVRYANTIIWVDKDAPLLEFVQEVLKSDESVEVRVEALSVVYPLYDKEFSTEERRVLYLNILFDSMADKADRIRTYAYDMLKDYYKMKEFTPNDDSILKILSEEHDTKEYERAVDQFKERLNSIEVTPFSPKRVIDWLKSLPGNPPEITIEECGICSTIPDNSAADMTAGESLDEYTSKLEVAIRFGYHKNKFLRCPLCGRFYKYEYEWEFLVPRSEEDEYLKRLDSGDVEETFESFSKPYGFKKIIICEHFLKLGF
ncbi:MAG: HEAT repeat domain-containing protein [Candidatus Thorarchaeota archaeon]